MNSFLEQSTPAEVAHFDSAWQRLMQNLLLSGEFAKIKPAAFSVYTIIAAHTGMTAERPFPNRRTIAEDTGLSVLVVERAMRDLAAMGYLEAVGDDFGVEYRFGAKHWQSVEG